ncbi:protein of unknown function [Marinobacter sp. LV10R510-11A]|uniref:DUF4194 domain-containing protein n=1 Tax=Marinobacter sp. LV10R510-11A TaxID=1415568 RepID=UPI000BB8084E|nr:DUF4194 domain-containing protein [Marinobacter sp. LV10R510-11A]SOB74794.1 protein of unknown function [Marinobacter sp. LV10R510-11A]
MSNIFDRLTAKAEEQTPGEHSQETPAESISAEAATQYTSKNLKATAQELLKFGLLEADCKPNLYQVAMNQTAAINGILEPLDLRLKVDDIRGLAFLAVSDQLFAEEDDEWSHPLMRRQRLTMEQSLLIAILRQHFIVHEQEAGIGAGDAVIELDELLPQIQLYLGDIGSDVREQKRLRNLLESLKTHGIVSDIDANEQVIIRPIITHLANPENLKNLLHHFRKLAGQESDAGAETP